VLKKPEVVRVTDPGTRQDALKVLRATYRDEKGWVDEAESQLPEVDLRSPWMSWFVAYRGAEPAGVLRIQYKPPVAQYRAYNVTLLARDIDVERFLSTNHIAEIGRFAIAPRYRRSLLIAVALMRAATRETVERGFTHYITDVFEDDPHSPYGFHTRVMGFAPVATHDSGELHCRSRRITLILDLKAAYNHLRRSQNWIFRSLTSDWDEGLHRRLVV